MKNFTDSQGRSWKIALTISIARRIKEALGEDIDILVPMEGNPPLATRIDQNIELFCNLLFVVCEQEAKEAQIDSWAFGARLGGDAIVQAHDAFFEEWVDFFRLLRRPAEQAAIERQLALMKKVWERAATAINRPEVDRKLESLLETAGNEFLKSQDTLESTPAPTASAN